MSFDTIFAFVWVPYFQWLLFHNSGNSNHKMKWNETENIKRTKWQLLEYQWTFFIVVYVLFVLLILKIKHNHFSSNFFFLSLLLVFFVFVSMRSGNWVAFCYFHRMLIISQKVISELLLEKFVWIELLEQRPHSTEEKTFSWSHWLKLNTLTDQDSAPHRCE